MTYIKTHIYSYYTYRLKHKCILKQKICQKILTRFGTRKDLDLISLLFRCMITLSHHHMSVAFYVQSVHIKYYIFSFKYYDFLFSASSVGDRPLPSSGSWVISNTTIYTEGMPRNASTLMDPESRIHRAYREGGGDPPPS